MIRESEKEQEFRAMQLRGEIDGKPGNILRDPRLLPTVPTVPPQSVNQLLNGDLMHSVRTWFSAVALADDMNKEAAYWYSNTVPVLGQVLDPKNNFTNPGVANTTLKSSAHSGYSSAFPVWDTVKGQAGMGSDETLDCLLPGRFIVPGRKHYISFIVARKDKYQVFPETAYIYAGFWSNQGANSFWVKGANPFALTGVIDGSPATTTERRYKVFARTDRASTILSSELILVGAPSDAAFGAGAGVSLSWPYLDDVGILSYDIYRYTPSTGDYHILASANSNTFRDNGAFDATATGYPTATTDRSLALTSTRILPGAGILNTIAIDGTPPWSTYEFPIFVPSDYNSSLATAEFLRIGIGGLKGPKLPDLKVTDFIVSGGTTGNSASAQFIAAHAGLAIILTDSAGVQTSNTIASYVSATQITLGSAVTNGTYTAQIEGGGSAQGILFDLVHSSFGSGAVFSHNAEDFTPPRPQNPVAAPTTSSQGGVGGGGSGGGGGPRCIELNQIVWVYGHEGPIRKRAGDIQLGDWLETGDRQPTQVVQIDYDFQDLWILETHNGAGVVASPNHPIIRTRLDQDGLPLSMLKKGDEVLVWQNGFKTYKVKRCEALGKRGKVVKISCHPSKLFIAGEIPDKVGGIVNHNVKPVTE